MKYYANCVYSGTSEKGLSILRTQYKKPLYTGQDFLPQIVLSMQFKPLQKENLSIKDKNHWSQNVLCSEVPLSLHAGVKISLHDHVIINWPCECARFGIAAVLAWFFLHCSSSEKWKKRLEVSSRIMFLYDQLYFTYLLFFLLFYA